MRLPEIPPDFCDPVALVAGVAWALYPPEKLDVHEAALKYVVLHNPGGGYSGPWSDELAPYLARPMACLSDPMVTMVAVMGPGQSAKSTIANAWLAHSIVVDPGSMIWLAPDKDLVRAYVKEKINPMIRHSPAIKEKQLTTASADNIFSKEFAGMMVSFVWPVASQMRMRSAPRWVIDDFDAVPDDIDGEGDPITLLGTRATTYEGKDRGFVASSPAKGRESGIEGLVMTGTDERWVWPCLHCGEYFTPDFDDHLSFRKDGLPEEAQLSAHLVCPSNGCIIEPREKLAMHARGFWIGPDQRVNPDGRRGKTKIEGPTPTGPIRSFRIDGLMGFASWGKLAAGHRQAEIALDRRQDETKLRAFYNTRIGKNYTSRLEDGVPVNADQLAARVEDPPLGQVPAWVRFLTASVDIQGNRFEVLVVGWGADGESTLVDRYAIRQLADGRTDISPGKQLSHWDVLYSRVLMAAYPLAEDPTLELPVVNTAIDSGGVPGVSENSAEFVRRAIEAGVPDWSVTLIKGAASHRAPMVASPSYDKDNNGKRRKDAVALYVLGVHELKDVIETRLRIEIPGPGYVHLQVGLRPEHFAELRGEEKVKGVWVKVARNETWDLLVYAEAARLLMREKRQAINWSDPPLWARPRPRIAAADLPALPAPGKSVTPAAGRRVINKGIE